MGASGVSFQKEEKLLMVIYMLSALGLLTLFFAYIFIADFIKNRSKLSKKSWGLFLGIGFITNFFDTLGIGSFAPTTAIFKLYKLVSDRLIPGTLNTGDTIPVVLQAFIFITIIRVEPITLIGMIFAATIGAVLGARIITKLSERKIQLGMGFALFAVSFVIFAGLMNWFPIGGEAIGLKGGKLLFAIVSNFVLGALMTIGVGNYAPCMALIYALGLSPKVAFPIMMGSSAFLMPAASIKFVKEEAQDRKASMSLTLAGSVGVSIAAYIIKSLPLNILKWIVMVVVLYTSAVMIKSAKKKSVS